MKQHQWIEKKAFVGFTKEAFKQCRFCGLVLDIKNPFFNLSCHKAPKTERELVIERLQKEFK